MRRRSGSSTCPATSSTTRDVVLVFANATEYGKVFETDTPVTFKYVRNTKSAPRPRHSFLDQYQQRIEPHGRYLLHNPDPGDIPSGWETGTVHFKHPLVVWFNKKPGGYYDEDSWKAQLQQHYKRQGLALSRAIVRDGYDGVVTVMPGTGDTREIVDLTWLIV